MKTKIFLGSTILCCALVFLGASQSNAENSGVTTVYAKNCNQTDPASCDFHGSAVYELKNNYIYTTTCGYMLIDICRVCIRCTRSTRCN